MRIGLVVADFEMSFANSFKHTADVKYGVKFSNSSVSDILVNLQQLKENLRNGIYNDVHVGYEFGLTDVVHVEQLLNTILEKFREQNPTKPVHRLKLYALLNQVREANTPSPTEIAKEVVTMIVTPPQTDKKTPKQQLEADAVAKSQERALKHIQKKGAKKQ